MRSLLFAFLFLLGRTAAGAGPNPAIENLSATAAHGKVSVRFELGGAFSDPQIVEALQSGLPTTVTYLVEIFRDRPNWFDDEIAQARIEVVSTFNSLTREYLLNYRRDRRLVRSETFTDLAALERRMTHIAEADFFDVAGRRPHKLKVRVKAELMRGWLMYMIPWEVATGWRETRVKTAAERAGQP